MRIYPCFIPHLACPNRCVFCDQEKITGKKEPDPAGMLGQFARDLENISDKGVELAFYGGNFTAIDPAIQEKILAGVRTLDKNNKVRSIRVSTRPDAINSEVLDLLCRFDVKTVELGVQSMDPAVLEASGRNYSPEEVAKASALIRQRGLTLGHQLMMGLPGEDEESFLSSVRLSAELKPDIARIYPVLVIEGTELAKMYQLGKYRPLELSRVVDLSLKAMAILEKRGIKLIRLGLHPDPALEKALVAGPYHQALRELVENKIWLSVILRFLEDCPHNSELDIHAPRRLTSNLIGHKKSNQKELTTICRRLDFHFDDQDSVRLIAGSRNLTLTRSRVWEYLSAV